MCHSEFERLKNRPRADLFYLFTFFRRESFLQNNLELSARASFAAATEQENNMLTQESEKGEGGT